MYAYDSTFRALSLSPEAEEQEPRAQELAPAARMHTLAAAWWQRLQLAPARSHSLALSLSRSLSVIVMVTVVVMVVTSSSSCCSSAVPIGKLFAWGRGIVNMCYERPVEAPFFFWNSAVLLVFSGVACFAKSAMLLVSQDSVPPPILEIIDQRCGLFVKIRGAGGARAPVCAEVAGGGDENSKSATGR